MAIIGSLSSITITLGPDKTKKQLKTSQVIPNYGLEDDLKGGKSPREISLISQEAVDQIQEGFLDGLCTKRFYPNLLVNHSSLHQHPVGTQFQIGHEVILELTAVGKKCYPNCPIRERGSICPLPRQVLYAKVITGGLINLDDNIIIFR